MDLAHEADSALIQARELRIHQSKLCRRRLFIGGEDAHVILKSLRWLAVYLFFHIVSWSPDRVRGWLTVSRGGG